MDDIKGSFSPYVNQHQQTCGKNILLIGGTSGIGFAVAQKVFQEGAYITISSSSKDKITNAVERLRATSPEHASNVKTYAADISVKENIEATVEGLLKYAAQDTTIDHVVFTAGKLPPMAASLAEPSFENVDAFLTVRFYGSLAIGMYAHKYITLAKTSSITLTSGSQACKPTSWLPPIIRNAVEGLMKGVAVSLARVRVNIVVPGFIVTELLEKLPKEIAQASAEIFKAKSLTKENRSPDDTSDEYLYFTKDSFVTGVVLDTNGGVFFSWFPGYLSRWYCAGGWLDLALVVT